MSVESLWLTAYHEAGHAVVSWVVGLEIERASIEPQGSSLGRVTTADIENMEAYDELLCRHLVSSYAGVKAEELCTGRPTDPDNPNLDPKNQGSDWDTVVLLTLKLADREESAQAALQEWANEEALRILRENWRGVEAAAEALLRHRNLDSADLSRILEEANCPRGEPVYEYEFDQLADREWDLTLESKALIEEGRHEEARRVAEERARLKSKMNELELLLRRARGVLRPGCGEG